MPAEPQRLTPLPERDLFVGALARTDPAERAAFLDAGCGGDAALRARVEALLRDQAAVGDFLETPAVAAARPNPLAAFGPGGTAVVAAVTEKPGDRIGRYKLLQKIGEGGVGVVYMAEQEEPVRRRVALKVIKLGMDTKQVIARFEAERQALAMMDHPNIARVLDAGTTDTGRPYFVMELVQGVKITDYCDQNHLSTEERLRLFIQVCQAIQHAHQKGIIHRDIKPSNILVTLHDGVPVPKVIDFGIAKATEQRLTDKTLFTEFAMFIGTPAYMSPEQALMSGLDIDTRSDIYALGVLLYELLTGRTPFDADSLYAMGLDECRRTIREQEPARPSTRVATLVEAELTTTAQQRGTEPPRLIHLLSGDLDWIAMKCLEKDRTRRYETASALAADVQRFLDGEPVLARPPSGWYRFQKFARRHRGALAAAAAVAAALFLGATISLWQAVRATRAEQEARKAQQQEALLRQQAERDRALARLNEYVADINLAQQSLAAGNYGRAVQLLDKHRPKPGEPDLRGFEWRYLWQISQGDEHFALPTQDKAVQALAFSPRGDLLVVGLFDRFAVFNTQSKTLLTNVPRGAWWLAFSADGHTLFTAGSGEREGRRGPGFGGGVGSQGLRLWNPADWSEMKTPVRGFVPCALSANGTRLATSRDGVRVWDTASGQELLALREAGGPMALSPDGRRLLAQGSAGLTLWSVDSGRVELVLPNSTNLLADLRLGEGLRPRGSWGFSPDGRWVVATRNKLSERGVFVLSLWDTTTGEEFTLPEDPDHVEHTGVISSFAFSPDGRYLATASMDYSIRLWDFEKRQRLATFQGHLSEVWAVAFAPDGQSLVSGARDGSVKWWPVRPPAEEDTLAGPFQPPLAISPDSRRLAAAQQGTMVFINLDTLEREQEIPLAGWGGPAKFRPPPAVAFNQDLTLMAHGLDDGRVQLWNTLTRESAFLKGPDRGPVQVALSPDGRILLTSGFGRGLRWWDLTSGTNAVLDTDLRRALFAPDGRTLACLAGKAERVELWDTATLTLRTNLVGPVELPAETAEAFSPDSRLLAVAYADDTVRLWDVATGAAAGLFSGHKQGVSSIAFAPDGKTLATASDDNTVKLWNVATQQELLTIRRLGGALRTLLFSPDGRLLVGRRSSRSPTGGLGFYRAPSFEETDAPRSPAAAR